MGFRQGCQIFLGATYQKVEKYAMATEPTYLLYQMVKKYTNIFNSKSFKNITKFGCMFSVLVYCTKGNTFKKLSSRDRHYTPKCSQGVFGMQFIVTTSDKSFYPSNCRKKFLHNNLISDKKIKIVAKSFSVTM
jgi:hypothetical protein